MGGVLFETGGGGRLNRGFTVDVFSKDRSMASSPGQRFIVCL